MCILATYVLIINATFICQLIACIQLWAYYEVMFGRRTYQVPEKPYMKRRDFFARLSEASIEILGSNPFYGSLEGNKYTYVPCMYKDQPTLLVVGRLRLQEQVYTDRFNLIYMDKWPVNGNVPFWRKLLLRHDLTDQIFVLCKELPLNPPSFMRRVVCLSKDSVATSSPASRRLPTMLFVKETDTQAMPNMAGFSQGSDIYVDTPGMLNVKNSPAYTRVLQFFFS